MSPFSDWCAGPLSMRGAHRAKALDEHIVTARHCVRVAPNDARALPIRAFVVLNVTPGAHCLTPTVQNRAVYSYGRIMLGLAMLVFVCVVVAYAIA